MHRCSCPAMRVPSLLRLAAVLCSLLALVAVGSATEWEGEIDGVGPDYTVSIQVGFSDQTVEDIHVTVTNTSAVAWGDFHFGIYDPIGGQDISRVDFIDASTGGEDPVSSQAGLSWVIDNVTIGARIDLYYYGDPIQPGETAWFNVQVDNPDHISFYGVLFYPTPVPTRACCFASGTCQVLPADQCIAAGGEVYTQTVCEPNPCPQPPTFACCLPGDEVCYMMTGMDCEAAGGVWYVDAVCSSAGGDFDCPLWRVCCIGIECVVVTEETCRASAGIWHPEWTACEPGLCDVVPANENSWGAIKGLYR